MPNRTDAEWQALDARIAREVMGLTQDEFFDDGTSVWWISDSGERRFLIAGFVDQPVLEYTEWQPHNDVAQALKVKDNILKDDWCFDLSNRPGTLAVVYFWQMLCPMVGIQGKAETDAKAICLAAEAWLNAQKELQDAEA